MRIHSSRLLPVLLVLLALGTIAARSADPVLTITYAGKTLSLTADDIATLPHQDFEAFDAHQKKSHKYTGFPAHDLLVKAGTPTGEKLRGAALRLVVVAHTKDNYVVSYALAEFESAFNPRTIYFVDKEDGQPMGDGAGPLRFIIPGDARPARWTRMITALEVVSVGEGR